MHILIIEDEKKTASFLQKGLTESGYVVDLGDGDEVMLLALDINYDLIILDVMLPGRDGWAICMALRRAGKQIPVLFLTAGCRERPGKGTGTRRRRLPDQTVRLFGTAGQGSPAIAARAGHGIAKPENRRPGDRCPGAREPPAAASAWTSPPRNLRSSRC